ncbi:MAG: hypothetical protein JXN59_16550 [Anaerolineae bacterium]|nr:hypothetical protein [Anaerolineae bacterium]
MTRSTRSGSLSLMRDFRLLIYLFVAFRLTLLIVYQPMIIEGVERGIAAGGDMAQFHAFARLSDEGLLPFRDYWSEFPPVWPWLYVGVYRLLGGAEGTYTAFASLLGLILLAADTGNLILVRRIGGRLHGQDTGLALAWIYALLLAPAVFIWWNFEALVAFALLLALWWLLQGREGRSALALLTGALVKFVPLVMLGAVWRYRDTRRALRYTLLALGGFVVVYAGIVLAFGEMGAASLVAQFSKASYGTVWALIDGNYATGVFGPIAERFDPALAFQPTGNPALIPSWLRLLPFAAFGLYVYMTTRCYDDRGLVAFVTITLLVFFLWAQGWSPQWLALIIPLTLLNFPNRGGVLALLLLSLVAFTEYPLLFVRTGDTGGVIAGPLVLPFITLILVRTLMLVGIVAALVGVLRRPARAEGGRS